ncbi:choice-of-anchor L domain-containing protein [Luteibaculum oceani]|uniref:T9SS type B sorting domain-containing protein n=1 Tax=Luteibaculum oceani TaxID=1294296 RepID=A0A5C6UTQ8_9FLAO|nr:choice-of-anchor L domain-containing protein [Luteibaculum oceani]TXC75626.1 T9SS type B sorting domain-containing protein [Luteibaculum oceani]
MRYGIFIFLLLLGQFLRLDAQIQVRSDGDFSDPNYLISEILTGRGVQIFNVQSYGSNQQFGLFSNGVSTIGLDSGIIMSSGIAEAFASSYDLGGGTTADFAFSETPTQGGGDADLLKLAQKTAQDIGIQAPPKMDDAAWISFEFIPTTDSVTLTFVFGSEEYPDYINSFYNDVFGFFVAGPNISGAYSAPAAFPNGSKNFAEIPNENLAITVSTVNDQVNSAYYIDNQNGGRATHYNGFTTTIEVSLPLVPCQRHYFRFAIADGFQNNFDSGVLIKAKGFSTAKWKIDQSASFQKEPDLFEEGCGNVQLSIQRLGGLNFTDSVSLSIDATSEAGLADISLLPQFVVFEPGDKVVNVQFNVLKDGLTEGVETLILRGDLVNGCAEPFTSSYRLNDYFEHELSNPNDETVVYNCQNDSIKVGVLPIKGYELYTYTWELDGVVLNENTDSIYVKPNPGSVLRITVGDQCTNYTVTKEWTFDFVPSGSPQIFIPTDTSAACPGATIRLFPDSVRGGAQPLSYQWIDEDGSLVGDRDTLVWVVNTNSNLQLTVTDKCGATDQVQISVGLDANASLSLMQNWVDTSICRGEEVEMVWIANGGDGNYRAEWRDGITMVQNSRLVSPLVDTSYVADIYDGCGNSVTTKYFVQVNAPTANFEIENKGTRVEVENLSVGRELTSSWFIDDVFYRSEENTSILLTDNQDHYLKLLIEDVAGCRDSLTKIFGPPIPIYIPNAFTPDGDGINDLFKIVIPPVDHFQLTVYDRWGNEVFSSEDPHEGWNGVPSNGAEVQSGNFVARVIIQRNNERYEKQLYFSLFK